MADDSMNKDRNDKQMGDNKSPNQTMQQEQAKASIGGEGRSEQGGMDKSHDKDRHEKSAIGGGENRSQGGSQTGEPGRARSELDDKSRSEPAGQR